MKKIIAFVMCIVMCMSLCFTAFAENAEGITYTATLDQPTITVSDTDQTVSLTIKASKPCDICFVGYTVLPGGLTVKNITSVLCTVNMSTDYNNGIFGCMTSDLEDMSGVDCLGTIEFTVPANTPAGTYTVGVDALNFGNQYGENVIEDGATVTTTLTIKSAACEHANKVAHPANDATCIATGNSAYWSCPDCGKFFSNEDCTTEITENSWVKEALGHSFTGDKVDNGNGTHSYKCVNAGCTEIGNSESHSSDTWQKDADKHWKECACGNKIEEAAHTWNSGEVTKVATCTATGVKTYTCSVCNATKTETIEMAEHDFENGSWVNTDQFHYKVCKNCSASTDAEAHEGGTATCSSQAVCTICNRSYGPKAAHNYGTLIPEVPATCTEPGTEAHYQCSACSGLFDEDMNPTYEDALVISALGHAYDNSDTYQAVSATGHRILCTRCQQYGEIVPHIPGDEWISGGNGSHYKVCKYCETVCEGEHCHGGTATCIAPAVCDVCKSPYGDVDANNHLHKVTTGDVAPTCTTSGHTGIGHCNDCGKDISEDSVIPALGHVWGEPTFTWADDYSSCTATFTCTRDNCDKIDATKVMDCTVTSETTESTCKDAGKTVYTATVSFDEYKNGEVCTDTKEVALPLAEHTYSNEIPETPATCTENGTKAHFACSVCDKLFVLDGQRFVETSAEDLVIPATDHKWDDGKVTKEATCEAKGEKLYTCQNDPTHTKTEEIPALGHKFGADGKCTVCGAVDPNFKPADNTPADPTKPATGDAGVGVWVALLGVSALLGTAIVVKKRHA